MPSGRNTNESRMACVVVVVSATVVVVVVSTVVVVVATHNLALGVLAGVILSGAFFTHKVMTMFEVVRERRGETAIYRAKGQIFYASVERFEAALGPESTQPDPADHVIIDVSKAAARKLGMIRSGTARVRVAAMPGARRLGTSC